MRAHIAIIGGLAAALAVAACGDDDGHTRAAQAAEPVRSRAPAPVELAPTDLTPAELAATMRAPVGAEVTRRLESVHVRAPQQGFWVTVSPGAADVAQRRGAIERNTINTLRAWLVDEPDAVLYESTVAGRAEFHVIVNATVGDAPYTCEDARGPVFTREQAQRMFDACRSLAAK